MEMTILSEAPADAGHDWHPAGKRVKSPAIVGPGLE